MKISVGSKNQVKVGAIKEMIADYEFLREAEVVAIEVTTEVADQPKSLEETIKGAMNRAKNAWAGCDFSFGIESGLMQVPFSKTGHMDFTVCAIFDGKEYHLGLSSAFEYPREVTRLILEEGLNAEQAANRIGITDNPKLGSHEGILGILTKGRYPRKEYTKEAIRMALIHLENAHLY